eukprot:gene6959-2230_t
MVTQESASPAVVQKARQWTHSIAGGVAGSISVLILHPFDVLKTRLQVQDGLQGQSATYRGAVHAVQRMWQQEGVRAFYQGLTPAVVGSGVAWSSYFYAYELIKTWHKGGAEQLSPFGNMISAAQAGAMVCLMTNPLWLVKTRLQLQQKLPDSAGQGSPPIGGGTGSTSIPRAAMPSIASTAPGFVDALVRIGQEEGLKGYYKGLAPSLVLQTFHGSIQFAVYEELKLRASKGGLFFWTQGSEQGSEHGSMRPVSSFETSVCAAASKLAASVITYPSQVVRSRLQQRFESSRELVYNSPTQVPLPIDIDSS